MVLPSASAVAEPLLSSAAQACASATSVSAEVLRSTMPSASASSPSTLRPVKISSLARGRPTRRGRKYMPPPSGMMPRWMYDQEKFAHSLAMMKSHASAVSAPRPEAAPFTAAMVGLGIVCSRVCV